MTIEIPHSRADRLAIRYMTTKAISRNMASTAGRESAKMYREAVLIEEIATGLLGPDTWAELLDRHSAPRGPVGQPGEMG